MVEFKQEGPTPPPTTAAGAQAAGAAAAESSLRQVLGELEAAVVQGDAATFDRHLAPEYVFTSPAGAVSTKAEVLSALRSGDARFTAYQLDAVDVRLYGRTAVVVGQAKGEGINPGGERFHGAYRFTSTWVERGGSWQLVAWQATSVTP